MLDEILNHVWMCVAYRDIYLLGLLNFTEASCWGSCCMFNGIHMPSHANACIHMFACRFVTDKALAGRRNRMPG
jgi:hypothetical protein